MKKILNDSRKVLATLVGIVLLYLVIQIFIMLYHDDSFYGILLFKILSWVSLIASIIYTKSIYNNQIRNNVSFGITRKETSKSWFKKIIIIFFINLLSLASIIVCSLIKGFMVFNGIDFFIECLEFFTGFGLYFLGNYLIFFLSSKNYKEKKKKIIVFIMTILIALISGGLSAIFILRYLLINGYEGLFLITYYGGIVETCLIIIGLILILVDKKTLYKGVY